MVFAQSKIMDQLKIVMLLINGNLISVITCLLDLRIDLSKWKKKNPWCDFILAEKADVGARVKISLKVVAFPPSSGCSSCTT